MESIILIILIIAFSSILFTFIFKFGQQEKEINLREAEILKVKNTFFLVVESLENTWLLSSEQSVFNAELPQYWYQGTQDVRTTGIASLIPQEMCSATNPKVCLPKDEHVAALLAEKLAEYYPASPVDISGIKLDISDIQPYFWLAYDRVISRVSQSLEVSYGDTTAESALMIEHNITSVLKRMRLAGWRMVDLALSLPGDASLRYSGTAISYLERVKTYLESKIRQIYENSDITDSYELIVPENSNIMPAKGGLLLHYDIKTTLNDSAEHDYLDEENKEFLKKPFPLNVNLEDYVPVLDCSSNGGLFTFSAPRDMLCAGQLYTCYTQITGIGSNLRLCGGRAGAYACGETGFRLESDVDVSPCYCQGFGGDWVPADIWECAEEVCTTDSEGVETCETVYYQRSCPAECDLNGLCERGACP